MKEEEKRHVVILFLCIGLSLSLFYLLLLNYWGIRVGQTLIDYQRFGTWSEAIAGLATTGAVVVALATLLWQQAAHRTENLEKQLQAETSVFHWLTSKEVRDEYGSLIARVWDVRVQNSTSAPIYHWKIEFSGVPDHLCSRTKRPLLPGDNLFNLPFLDNTEPSGMPESTLVFQGLSETYWERSARGALKKVAGKRMQCSHVTVLALEISE